MSQSRKQNIQENIRRDRRRKRLITLVSAVALIIVVLIAVYVTTRPSNQQFPFPCLGSEGAAMHIHPWLQITINNQSVSVPANIGIVGFPPCYEPVHTHDTSGILHIEAPDLSHNFTLGDFFTIWKDTYPTILFQQADRPVTFNQTSILGFQNDQTHQVRLIVDGGLNNQYSSLNLVPLDYCSSANASVPPCSPTAGGDPSYPGGYPYGTSHTIQIQY